MGFSKDFLWGAASAAHQVEGGYLDDGKSMDWNVTPDVLTGAAVSITSGTACRF